MAASPGFAAFFCHVRVGWRRGGDQPTVDTKPRALHDWLKPRFGRRQIMVVWWIIGAGAWTFAIWLTAMFVGVRLLGSRGPKQPPLPRAEHNDAAAAEGFIGYPTDCMFAVIDEAGEAQSAIAELRASGLDDHAVSSFSGESGAIRIDARGSRHGLFASLIRVSQAMSMDASQAQQYENEARAGHTVIAIHGADTATRERSRATLKAHGAHYMNYYARLHFEILDP